MNDINLTKIIGAFFEKKRYFSKEIFFQILSIDYN